MSLPSSLIDCLPPLQHSRGNRWPLVLWDDGGSPAGLAPATVQKLLARGIVPHVRLSRDWIPVARAIQAAGAPVVVLEGRAGVWPYDLEPDWALRYPLELEPPQAWRDQPAPYKLAGWAKAARQLRQVLEAFRAAGIRVDAVWLDYENQPSTLSYAAVKASPEAVSVLPAAAMSSEQAFRDYRRQLWLQLLSAYVAGPTRELYPDASVSNWAYTLSSDAAPILSWHNWRHPPVSATLFTHTEPIAYGIDTAFQAVWHGDAPRSQARVDAIYLHILLRQVSADAWNRRRTAPYLGAVAWVARWVADHPDWGTPVMSRTAYREALRQLWLRGLDAMQVFNPQREGHPEMTLAEVQDAAAVYDEMLAYRELLDHGEVMSYRVPAPDEPGVLWSGLREGDRAVVRVLRLPGGPDQVELEAWPGIRISLPADAAGATYLLSRDPANLKVTVRSAAE